MDITVWDYTSFPFDIEQSVAEGLNVDQLVSLMIHDEKNCLSYISANVGQYSFDFEQIYTAWGQSDFQFIEERDGRKGLMVPQIGGSFFSTLGHLKANPFEPPTVVMPTGGVAMWRVPASPPEITRKLPVGIKTPNPYKDFGVFFCFCVLPHLL